MFSRETQAIMDAAVDAVIVIDHRGRMLAVNDSTAKMFGYRVDEMLGENVSMLMTGPHRDEHDGYLARYLETGVARIIGIGREVIAARRDGTPFPARLSVGRVAESEPPRFVGMLREITAEREATAALKHERDRARAYLELNDGILVTLDTGRRIREVNARGTELFSVPPREILGHDWLDYIRGESERERAEQLLAAALASNSSAARDLEAVIPSGEFRKIHWRCIAMRDAAGTHSGWLCAGTNITDRALREQEARLAQDRITRVAHLATMGEMAAGLAHELNQPLTAITTYARACERYIEMPEPDMPELREAVREIGAEGLRAGRIISRLRQLVRNDAPDERTSVDINEVIEDLEPLLAADARVHDTKLRLSLAPQLPAVSANAAQLQQVVLNLVRNAFEAVLEVPAVEREVEIATMRHAAGDLAIRVSDSGPGINPAIADRIFDPFTTSKPNGTGLGLAISRTIVHAHGGAIDSQSAMNRGACFQVRLKALEDEGP
jgi:two-component system sensor kinase FixL